jgi:hypothetical protein
MKKLVHVLLFAMTAPLIATAALAHCDSLNGPVVSDARLALKEGRVEIVLKWVAPRDESRTTVSKNQRSATSRYSVHVCSKWPMKLSRRGRRRSFSRRC